MSRYRIASLALVAAIAAVTVASFGGPSGIARMAALTQQALQCSSQECLQELAEREKTAALIRRSRAETQSYLDRFNALH